MKHKSKQWARDPMQTWPNPTPVCTCVLHPYAYGLPVQGKYYLHFRLLVTEFLL